VKPWWRALRGVVLGSTIAACINIPPFQKKDAGPQGDGSTIGSGVVATVQNNSIDVSNQPLYHVMFGSEPYHYPYAMTVGATSVMGGGNPSSCNDEFDMGIGLYPAPHIIGHGGTSPVQDDIAIDFAGPPVAKVNLEWQTQFQCSGSNGTASGRSMFTFFPDGRINRSDQVTLGSTQLDSTMCACGAGGNWYLTSFFTTMAATTNTVAGAIVPTTSTSAGNPADPAVCFNGHQNAFQFAMGWRSGSSARVRTPVEGTNATIAFVYDLVPGGTSTTIGPVTGRGQTTWWVSTSSSCGALLDQVAPYADNSGHSLPTLNVQAGAGTVQPIGVALDGIFGGENGQGSMGYQSADPVIKLTTDAALAGFAFWLALGSGEEIASVTKSPAMPDPWYGQQIRNGSNHRLFWFPDGLQPGQTITITIK